MTYTIYLTIYAAALGCGFQLGRAFARAGCEARLRRQACQQRRRLFRATVLAFRAGSSKTRCLQRGQTLTAIEAPLTQ